jgi:tetratricopeptide (TPR) repeat protein
MSKRKKRKSGRRAGPSHKSSTSSSAIRLFSHQVTREPVLDAPHNKLPPDLDREIDRLLYLVREGPAQAVVELEGWIEKYPDAGKLYNFLWSAYLGIKDPVNAERVVRENYRRNPDYIFAKLNYAELCLREGKPDEIPVIFDNKYDISLLYPQRKLFHITECTSFMAIMGWYFCEEGELERARVYLRSLQSLAPDHPATADLGRRLQRLTLSEELKFVKDTILSRRQR